MGDRGVDGSSSSIASRPGGPTSKRETRIGCIVIVGAMTTSLLALKSPSANVSSPVLSTTTGRHDVEAARLLDLSLFGLDRLVGERD